MYPFWEVPFFTSGIVIALIATFHILPCHLATGAFWFSVYVERKAVRQNRPELKEFVQKFTLLILVFCFVIGSLTGVGIWYSATVASPRAISGLIHNYVWGWATEWVFFIIEIATIYVYYYTLGRIDDKSHLKIGWIYAWAAWISMVIITGILAFMLSSDKWLQTGGFFDGFFNSTYWPQLFTRTALMFAIAGVYAVTVASRMSDEKARHEVVRTAAVWGIAGLAGTAVFMAWYLYKLPEPAKELSLGGGLPYLGHMLTAAGVLMGVIFLYFLVVGLIRPQFANVVTGIIAMVILFAAIGAGEGFREGIRRPWIINQYMYGHQVVGPDLPAKAIKSEVTKFQEEGLLKNLYFVPDEWRDSKDQEIIVKTGRILALHQCGNCHSFEQEGKIRPLPPLLADLQPESPDDLVGFLDSLGDYPYMPPFAGDDQDKQAVGAYLFYRVLGNPMVDNGE